MKGAAPVDHPLERMIFFSDAVFAIAITLLVIEIEVPHLGLRASTAAFRDALVEIVPSIAAFALSFFVIGRFWIGHHNAFSRISHYRPALLWPNLRFLCAIAFMPFATAFLGANLGAFVPALVYNLAMLLTAVLNLRLVRLVMQEASLEGDVGELRDLRSRPQSVVAATALSVLLSPVIPAFSQIGLITIPLWQRLFARRKHTA